MMMCPICNVELVSMDGEKIHPGDSNYGVTVYCANKKCSAQEVFGHGDNVKQACEVIVHKYKHTLELPKTKKSHE